MTADVQGRDEHAGDGRPTPSQALVATTARVAPDWLRRISLEAAAKGGAPIAADDAELARVVDTAASRLVAGLSELVQTDVDEQRTNPLSLFRETVAGPTRFLLDRGVRPPVGDRFAADHFPDDVFGLGPASWSDVHPELHEAGIAWGAWKAMTVLRRRREEGLR